MTLLEYDHASGRSHRPVYGADTESGASSLSSRGGLTSISSHLGVALAEAEQEAERLLAWARDACLTRSTQSARPLAKAAPIPGKTRLPKAARFPLPRPMSFTQFEGPHLHDRRTKMTFSTRLSGRSSRFGAALLLGLLLALASAGAVRAQDSQSMSSDMNSMPGMLQKAQAQTPPTAATVNGIDPSTRKVNISHEAIPALNWPAMTMDFTAAEGVDLEAVQAGSKVLVTVSRRSDGAYMVDSITPAQ